MAQVYVPGAVDRTAAVNAALDALETSPVPAQVTAPAPPSPISGNSVKISGDARTSVGIYSNGKTVFTRANADLDEKNFRILSTAQYNNGINTYDPALYSRLKVVLDASVASAVVSVHLNISADPWSYTAKSKTQMVTSAFGDTAKVQYLFWGNTGYTVNTIVNTLRLGDAFAMPEIKVTHRTVPAVTVGTDFGDTFNIPAAKLNYTFFPLREAWVDIKPTEELKLRIFPMGYEDQALTSDDPLKLSNNKMWWEESPWINSWQQGTLNVGGNPVDFTKGQWDRSLSFFTKDSDGQRLTALRGVALDVRPTDETSIKATVAAPKTLWQDYGDPITALPASVRIKQFVGELFYVGTTANVHQGYADGHKDAENYTGGLDSGFVFLNWFKLNAEWATSKSRYDETTSDFASKFKGNAYYASLTSASNSQDMINKDYFGLQPIEKTDVFYKGRIYFARMDAGFESSLSDYHQTRDDSFWSDHLTFYPSDYRYMPGTWPSQSEYDLEPFAIGNGIDYGRTVVGWRGDTSQMGGKLEGLLDIRHVTDNNGNKIENVARAQWTYKATDKLTTKGLLMIHDLPNTTAGFDPFVTDGNTGLPLANTAVVDGKDPSLETGSLGARYELFSWAALSGVWEYSNDFTTIGSDEFPRGDLNSASFITFTQNGKVYRRVFPFLYDQNFFDQAPYNFHNLFKTGLEFSPSEKWHIYLDYTRNPYKFAGNIDDNMNHFGIETAYVPFPKIGFFLRYTFSQWYDIGRLLNNQVLDYRGFNNIFFETRMILPKDVTLSIQYGVGPAYNVQTSSSDPLLAFYSTAVIETQHVVRIVFDKRF
jgi:hypothetical protein